MQLIPDDIRRRLLENGRQPTVDHAPVVLLFNPHGVAIWLINQMAPQYPDILFGLVDYGFGVRYGTVRLSDLENHVGALGIGIHRDLYFHLKPPYPLSVYATAAHERDRITTRPAALADVARRRLRLVTAEARS